MKIMIVDDHEDMRRVLRNIVSISTEGPVEIIECDSGEDAVRQYILQHPDFVLMDIQLKGMSGFEAIEKINLHDENAKVIIVTSHDMASFRKKAEQLYVKGCISKENLSEITPIIQTLTQK